MLSVLKSGGNSIYTSYIERNNLTLRNGWSRLIRKTIDFSKCLNPLIMHLCLFFAWFDLAKPRDALKIEIADIDGVGNKEHPQWLLISHLKSAL